MILVTGATGKLGQLVVKELLKTNPAEQIVAAVRSPEKAKATLARGVVVRKADYSHDTDWDAALNGVERVLLISSSEIGKRATQHQTVIQAAKRAGVKLLAYTSILRADSSQLGLAKEHRLTEEMIKKADMAYTFLRNSWYLENHTENLASAIQHRTILGAAGDGRFSSASRADFAAAAATVLGSSDLQKHAGKVYELAGDTAFDLRELAEAVSQISGKTVRYQNLPEMEYAEALVQLGLPAPFAKLLADSDAGAARGELESHSRDLHKLIGRPTTPLIQAIRDSLRSES